MNEFEPPSLEKHISKQDIEGSKVRFEKHLANTSCSSVKEEGWRA